MSKSNLNLKLVGIILGILVMGMIYLVRVEYILTEREINNLLKTEIAQSEISAKQLASERVVYVIDKGEGNLKTYQIIPAENSTVFPLLEELAKRENFKVESKVYEGMGVFVESIDGVKNGTENKYWQYWVNRELPMVAADKKEVKGGDKVEWKFAPSPF